MRPFVFCKARAVGKMQAPKHRLSSEIVRRAYPWIHLLFCPGSCTPVGQPMDAGWSVRQAQGSTACVASTHDGQWIWSCSTWMRGKHSACPSARPSVGTQRPRISSVCPVHLLTLACLACAHTLTVTSLSMHVQLDRDARAARPEAQIFRGALRARNFWSVCERGRNFWMGVRTDRPEFMLYHGLVHSY